MISGQWQCNVQYIISAGTNIHRRRLRNLIIQYKEALNKIRWEGGTALACEIMRRMVMAEINCLEPVVSVIGWRSIDRKINYPALRYGNTSMVKVQYNRYGHLSHEGISVLDGLIARMKKGFNKLVRVRQKN